MCPTALSLPHPLNTCVHNIRSSSSTFDDCCINSNATATAIWRFLYRGSALHEERWCFCINSPDIVIHTTECVTVSTASNTNIAFQFTGHIPHMFLIYRDKSHVLHVTKIRKKKIPCLVQWMEWWKTSSVLLGLHRVALFWFAIICFSPVASGSCFCKHSLNPLRPATQLFLCSLLLWHLLHTWILQLSCECHIIKKLFSTQHQCGTMERSC